MHIGIVTETFWPEVNGVAMTLNRWATGLRERGHTVEVVCPAHPVRPAGEASTGIDIVEVPGLPMPGYREVRIGLPARRHMRRLWRRRRPDIVYVATEGPLGIGAVNEAHGQLIPVVSGFHTNFHHYIQYYRMAFLRPLIEAHLVRLHNRTSCTLVPTPWQQRVLEEMGIVNVEIVGRGVDTSTFDPGLRSDALRRRWGVDDATPVLIHVGRIAEEKNLDLLLKAWQKSRQKHPDTRLVMVGDGPARARIASQHPDVILPGSKSGRELGQYFASGDVFVFPSKTETFGNVVLEAMTSGLGVVAFDYAAAAIHLSDGLTGCSSPLDDDSRFVSQVTALLEDPALLCRVRRAAARYGQQQGWDAVYDQLELLLAQRAHVPRAMIAG